MNLPTLYSVNIKARQFLLRVREGLTKLGEMVIVKSTVTDTGAVASGLPRATILRPGMVLGKKAADGLYYPADDVTNVGNLNQPASISSLIAIAATVASKVFKFKVNGGPEFSVTMGGGDNTCDLVVTALNANARFAANLIADKVATPVANTLRIRTLRAGVNEYFELTDGDAHDQGGTANDTYADNTKAGGSDGDYRVLGLGAGGHEDHLDMLGPDAAVADKGAPNLLAGEFDESELLNATPESKAVLARRGSIFG